MQSHSSISIMLEYFSWGRSLVSIHHEVEKACTRRDWGQEEKGTTEDEMAGWHHQLDGREFEWIPGVGDGQGGLACCNSWGRKESDTTEWLNWTELILKEIIISLKQCVLQLKFKLKQKNLNERGNCRRVDTSICMTESLHCSTEAITTLLIWLYTPIQNKKF